MNDADHATRWEDHLQFAIALRLSLIALAVMIVEQLLLYLRPTRPTGGSCVQRCRPRETGDFMSVTPSAGDRLSERTKRLLLVAFVVVPALLLFAAGEIYVRVTTPYDDLWALTGRSVSTLPLGTGTLLPDSVTWPWQVAENLRQRPNRRRQIEFINAALGGYTTFESYGRLWSRLRFYSPDIVVVYHGWNEMYYFRRVDKIANWRTLPDGYWGLEGMVPVTVYAPRWYDWLVRPSQTLTKVRLRLSTAQSGEAQAVVFQRTLHDEFRPAGAGDLPDQPAPDPTDLRLAGRDAHRRASRRR
jgi:hypothetical protein